MKEPQKYRSKGRIFADILRAVQADGPAKVTHILYKANLSHDRLTKYLVQLEETGLILKEPDGDRSAYSITEKGNEVPDGVPQDGGVRRCLRSRHMSAISFYRATYTFRMQINDTFY